MTITEMAAIVAQIEFQNYVLVLLDEGKGIMLQGRYYDPDIVTGNMELQHTRKWPLSPHMTKSEIVQTAFKCCITSMEHRTREAFKYRGYRIFGPHFDVDELAKLCAKGRFDVRPPPPGAPAALSLVQTAVGSVGAEPRPAGA